MITETNSLQISPAPQPTLRKLFWVSPLTMLLAAVANIILYFIAGSIYPEVTAWSGAGVGQIMGANIVYLLIGTVVAAIIGRFSSRPARHFLIVATVGMVLSLWLPISAALGYDPAGTPVPGVATAVTLSLMHVISYAITVPMFNQLVLR